MSNAVRTRSMTRWMRSVAIPLLILTTLVGTPTPGVAAPSEHAKHGGSVILLPGATSAEGIAKGRGSTFYAGDLFAGDIFEATSNVALRRWSSMRLLVAWQWAWCSIDVTICSSSPVASPDRHVYDTGSGSGPIS